MLPTSPILPILGYTGAAAWKVCGPTGSRRLLRSTTWSVSWKETFGRLLFSTVSMAACPEGEKTTSPCNPSTCQQEVTETRYLAVNASCVRLPPVKSLQSCCCRQGEVPYSVRRECDAESGLLIEVHTFGRFDKNLRQCVPATQRRVIQPPDCEEKRHVKRGICNKLTGFATDVLFKNQFNKASCSCEMVKKLVPRKCDCAHLPLPEEQVQCDEALNVLTKVSVTYKLKDGECIKTNDVSRRQVVCPMPVSSELDCDPRTCMATVQTTSYIPEHCKCVPRLSTQSVQCCCPRDHRSTHCLENGTLAVQRLIKFRLDRENRRCEKSVHIEKKEIACDTNAVVELQRSCHEASCHPVSLMLQNRLEHCRCVQKRLKVLHKDKYCCCPPPRTALQCFRETGVLQKTTHQYELVDEKCVERKDVLQERISCPDEKTVHGSCDPLTKRRLVTRTFYVIEDCKCVQKVDRAAELCDCPQEYTEKRCAGDGRLELRTTTFRLVERDGGPLTCAREDKVTVVPVTCPTTAPAKVIVTECLRNRRNVTTFRHVLDPVSCSCRVREETRVEACDCEKKNFRNVACIGNALVVSIGEFSSRPGDRHCTIKASQKTEPIDCPRNEETVNSGAGCTVEREGGLYRAEIMRWQEVDNCRCVPRQKVTHRLCSCQKPQTLEICEDNSKLIIENLVFNRVEDRCMPNHQIVNKEIRCEQPTRIVGTSACVKSQPSSNSKVRCEETITVEEQTVQNCKCVKRLRTFKRRCCAPPPVVRRVCDRSTGQWLTTTHKYKLTESKLLYSAENVEIWDRDVSVVTDTTAEQVVCPEPEVSEQCNKDTGVWTKTVTEHKRDGCTCKATKVSHTGHCYCQAKFGDSVVTKCLGDEEVEEATKTWSLVDGKCEPKVKISRRIVDCSQKTHLRRVEQSACLVGADGVGWRNTTVFGPRSKGCHCISAPLSSVAEICSCPKNLTVTQCMPGGKVLLRTHTSFALARKPGGVECLKEVTQARLDPCVGQAKGEMVKPSACNPTTCQRLIEITTSVPENCKCVTKRTQRTETCCCPPPTEPKLTCNQAENILTKEVRVHQLLSALPIGDRMRQVEPFCDTQLVTMKVKVFCADQKPKIMMTACKANFRTVKVIVSVPVNCTCVEQVAQVSRMRCVCPRPQTRVSECGAAGKAFVATETITNWTAIDCVCMPKVQQRDFICDCGAKFPPQTKRECKLDSLVEVEVTRWSLQGRKCVPDVTKSSSRIICEVQPKPSKGPCDAATGRRKIHWLKQIPINCECQWKPMPVEEVRRRGLKLSEACVCPEPRTERVCRPGGSVKRLADGSTLAHQVLELRTIRFSLVDGECRGLTESTVRNVTCAIGTRYIRTECDALTRTNQEIRVTGSLEGCQCRKVSARRTCQCACPAPKETTECDPRGGVLRFVRETYQLDADKCSCVASTHVSEKQIDCPEDIAFERSTGPCAPKPNATGEEVGDMFRLVTWKTVSRDGCKCVQRNHRLIELCGCPEAKKLTHCNETTGIATTTKLQPVIENCECKSAVQTYQTRCKCNLQTSFVRQTACSKDCKITIIQQREKLTSDGVCKPELIAQVKKCCCPPPTVIRRSCDSSNGMSSITTRSFKLVQGECIPVDQTTTQATQCPKVSRRTQCVELSDQQQAWKTVLVMWKSSTKQSACSRREIFTKLQPVVCSIPPQNISECYFDAKRHAFVRRILNFKTRLEGCHCVSEPPAVTFQVCSCAKPVRRVKCEKKDGVIHASRVRFEISADGTHCVAHETRKTWRKVCFPSMPLLRSQTTCADSKDGQRYKVYMHKVREGCNCVARETRVAFPCACPAAVQRTDCSNENTQVETSISYVRQPDGSCERQQKIRRLPVECKLPANLQLSGREYTVRLSANGTVVEHVYACGSSCLRKVLTASVSGPRNCKCAVLWQESTEACCCRGASTKSLAVATTEAAFTQPNRIWRDCSGPNAMLIRHQRRWYLQNGICRAFTFTHAEPLVCITLSKAEVVFLVDESVSSRIDGYSLRVRELLKHTIRTFKSDRLDGSGTDYRFAVVKYASSPSIAFNLDDYDVSPPMLHHVDNLHYEGRLSNLGRALDLTNREVLSRSRKDIAKMIYLISDGVNDISAAPDMAAALRASGVQINVLAFGSDKRGHIFLSKLASEPKQRHFVVLRTRQRTKELSDWLIQTLCLRACPPSKVTRGACSRKTNCVGYIYSHVYQYSPVHGRCLGTTRRRAYECCCPQEPRSNTRCVNGRLINTKEVWRLRVNKLGIPACHQFKLEKDVTPILEKGIRDLPRFVVRLVYHLIALPFHPLNDLVVAGCSLTATVVQGTCLPDGTRTDKIITKRLVDCQCKEFVKSYQRRCFCPAKKSKTQCYSDKVQETTQILSRLVDGQCEEIVDVTRSTIVCSEPKVFATKCDSLTCQRRVVFVEERAHQCKCVRSLKAMRETCCCPAREPIKRTSCAHDDTKLLAVAKTGFVNSLRTCLTTEEFTYEAVACPTEPIITRSSCRATQASEEPALRSEGAARLDPHLLYRRVTIEQVQLTNCQCTRRRHSVFEVCGCREPERRLVRRCHQKQGILVTYEQNYQLTVVEDNQTYVGGKALGRRVSSLLQAHCRPTFSAQIVTRTVCPDSNMLTGPCVRSGGDEGRAYRRVEFEEWQREGCECKKAAPRIVRKLCGCRKNVWYRQECRKTEAQPGGVLVIHRIREKLASQSGKELPVCKVEVRKSVRKIECPPPRARYTNCVNGTLWVTVELVTLRDCKCETSRFRRPLKCMQFNRAGERTDGGEPLLPRLRHPYDGNNTDRLPSRLMDGQWRRSMEALRQRLQELGLSNVKTWPGDAQKLLGTGPAVVPKAGMFAPPAGLAGPRPQLPSEAKKFPQGHQKSLLSHLPQMLFKGLKVPAVPSPLGQIQRPSSGRARRPGLLLFNDLPKGPLPQRSRSREETTKRPITQTIHSQPSISTPPVLPSVPESLNFVQCADILPSEKCLQLERKPHSSCDKPGQIRDHLCRQTCRTCQDCPLNRTDFEVVHAEEGANACLLTDLRLDRRYFIRLLKEVGFAECRRACASEPHCLSFDFYVPSANREDDFKQPKVVPGSCVLNRVDLRTLRRRTLPELVPVGATPEALKAHGAARCLLFRRVCLEDCELPKLQYTSPCECEQMKSSYPFAEEILTGSEPRSGRMHCTRKATLVTQVHGTDGKCQQRTRHLSVVCQPTQRDQLQQLLNTHRLHSTNESRNLCVDQRPTNWCEESARIGGCKDALVKKVCGGTCGVCICKRGHTYYGKCQSTGRMTVLRVHYKFDPHHGRCVASKEAKTVVCDRCPVGNFELVTPCDKASKKRQLIRISAVVSSAKTSAKPPSCRFKVRKQELDCHGCTFADGEGAERQSISACQLTANNKFRLAVRKEYMVNNSGCCEIRRSYRLFPCKGCPKAHSTTSKCVDNFRLRRIVFYTRPSTGKFSNDKHPIPAPLCLRHVIVEKESCIQQLEEAKGSKTREFIALSNTFTSAVVFHCFPICSGGEVEISFITMIEVRRKWLMHSLRKRDLSKASGPTGSKANRNQCHPSSRRAEYASYTWRSAECLAQAIALGEISVTGKRILELGAGTGLCGLTALKCGATWTTFSDLDGELILESLNESCRKNDVTAFDFIVSDWNNVPCELLNVDFDLILAADCMFDKKVFRPFAETVSFLLHKNPSASAVVAYENRG
ncbi:hypothetical protein SprV_0501750900 [Sparganum proliferum]